MQNESKNKAKKNHPNHSKFLSSSKIQFWTSISCMINFSLSRAGRSRLVTVWHPRSAFPATVFLGGWNYTSPKIDQSKAPINTMTASCATVDVSRKLTKRARLDENITFLRWIHESSPHHGIGKQERQLGSCRSRKLQSATQMKACFTEPGSPPLQPRLLEIRHLRPLIGLSTLWLWVQVQFSNWRSKSVSNYPFTPLLSSFVGSQRRNRSNACMPYGYLKVIFLAASFFHTYRVWCREDLRRFWEQLCPFIIHLKVNRRVIFSHTDHFVFDYGNGW